MGEAQSEQVSIRCISLWQPWATLVTLGSRVKPHETRNWSTQYRGPLLIHAAKHRDADSDHNYLAANVALIAAGMRPVETFPLGAIVGACHLVSCSLIGGFFPAEPDHELDERFGDWSKGRYAWSLSHALSFDPVPCAVSQGFWEPPADVLTACVRNARAAAHRKFDMAQEVAEHLIDRLFPSHANVQESVSDEAYGIPDGGNR